MFVIVNGKKRGIEVHNYLGSCRSLFRHPYLLSNIKADQSPRLPIYYWIFTYLIQYPFCFSKTGKKCTYLIRHSYLFISKIWCWICVGNVLCFNEFRRQHVRAFGEVEVPKLKQKAFGTPFRLTLRSDTRVTNGHIWNTEYESIVPTLSSRVSK